MNISTILSQIDLGAIALPEFQRGYVWNRDQVRELVRSLYKRFPIGSLLVWVTKTDDATHRGDQALPPGTIQLLLDGQQRVSSLYGIIRGKAPAFFEGTAQAFTGIYFNLEDETFEFYSPLKMRDDPRWVDITALMQQGAGVFIQKFVGQPEFIEKFPVYLNRLNAVDGIKHIDLHVEQVTGSDKTVDVVVDIFNRVNSGGTKLSKGDLALAKVCAGWPGARAEMNKSLENGAASGSIFVSNYCFAARNTVLTGEALFSALDGVETAAFREALFKAERHIDTLLNLMGVRLGLDHDRVLGSRYSFPLMARYLDQRGGKTHHSSRTRHAPVLVHSHNPVGPLCRLHGDRTQPGPRPNRGGRRRPRPLD